VGRSREIDNTWWYGGRIEALVNDNIGAAKEWTRRRFVLALAVHVHPGPRSSHNGFHVLRSVECVQVEAGNCAIRYGMAGGVSRCWGVLRETGVPTLSVEAGVQRVKTRLRRSIWSTFPGFRESHLFNIYRLSACIGRQARGMMAMVGVLRW
jgi:hypothetical protein